MFGALPSLRLDHLGGESLTPGSLDTRRIETIRDHDRDTGIGYLALSDCVGYGKEI